MLYEDPRESTLISLLENLPPGVTEIMTHPGLADGSAYDRTKELQILTDPEIRQVLADNQVILVDFSFVLTTVVR
jgi:predicted glycoside hydrolase/deacetylase ChbG (UPF0249 family)